MRYALTVTYDGTQFGGWQIQKNARTVQEELEKAARTVFGCAVKMTGSGRTDAGVHAEGQVCHFDVETEIPAPKIAACLNLHLPDDVRVTASAQAEGFDATKGKQKTYRYTFYYATCELPLLSRYAVRVRRFPDVTAMREAARLYEGRHDYKAFCAAGSSAKTSERTVLNVNVVNTAYPDRIQFDLFVTGEGFLYNMVRIMAGELYEIGCGKPSGMEEAFATGRRDLLGKTMPSKGLTLVNVKYERSPFDMGSEGV